MFARHVTMKLRADSLTKFVLVMENGVIPLLREQEGFLDQITLISAERVEAIVITLWDRKESEEAFNRTRNPEVISRLLEVIDRSPEVGLFEVVTSISKNIDHETTRGKSERYNKKYQGA